MSSEAIYSNLPLAYVYKITEISSGKIYIGSRWANRNKRSPENDLGKAYFTSGVLKKLYKASPENYTAEIIYRSNETYFNPITGKNEFIVWYYEQILIRDLFRNKIPRFNKHYRDPDTSIGVTVADTSGQTVYEYPDGTRKSLPKTHADVVSGLVTHWSIGTLTMKNSKGENVRVKIGDPRIEEENLIWHLKNKAVMKDKDGNKISIDVNNPRMFTGELVGHTKGARNQNNTAVTIKITDPTGREFIKHGYRDILLEESGLKNTLALKQLLNGAMFTKKSKYYGWKAEYIGGGDKRSKPNKKIIRVYNPDHVLIYEIAGIKQFALESVNLELPTYCFQKSYKNGGTPLDPFFPNHKKYKGWYATID